MSINGYPSVVRWLNNLRHSSAETYLHYLKRFCDYAKLNPDQLVEAAKKDPTPVHDTLKAFRRQLETGNNSSNTCQIASTVLFLAGVRRRSR